MVWIYVARVSITFTFLTLAAGGPYAIIQLRRFIRAYSTAHAALEERVKKLEEHPGSHGDD